MIAQVTLGVAIDEAHWKVREEGGNNRGPRVDQYLKNTDPPIHVAAPWCAAFVQFCSDVSAKALKVPNPLDDVKLEALVQSYVDWASKSGLIVNHGTARPGDLVCFRFNLKRWDHIGIVLTHPDATGSFLSVEGNTNEAGSREGDGVIVKKRTVSGSYPTTFIRWG